MYQTGHSYTVFPLGGAAKFNYTCESKIDTDSQLKAYKKVTLFATHIIDLFFWQFSSKDSLTLWVKKRLYATTYSPSYLQENPSVIVVLKEGTMLNDIMIRTLKYW